MNNEIRMPQPEMLVQTHNCTVGELMLQYKDTDRLADYPWAKRFVMGFPLPSWQRPFVWTEEQQVRFITSLWIGVDVGTYMVNSWKNTKSGLAMFSDLLLDGQQRLGTIQLYIENMIAVPDEDGCWRLWDDLPTIEKRRFRMRTFARATVDCFDEAKLRRLYDLHNFGGTAHTEDQRAS